MCVICVYSVGASGQTDMNMHTQIKLFSSALKLPSKPKSVADPLELARQQFLHLCRSSHLAVLTVYGCAN